MSAQKASIAEQGKDRLARFENQIEELRATLKIPGLSAAIVKDQKPIWLKGFGYADLERKIAATAETNYSVASLTKTFASTLLMQLVEQGKLDLDDPMSKYSPEFQKRYKNEAIKVRHVLTHTSHGTPGEGYKYDGRRFVYLSDVVTKASGRRYRELLVKNILDKIEMSASVPGHDVLESRGDSSAWLDAEHAGRYEKALANLAIPYHRSGSEVIKAAFPSKDLNASAGLISNVIDLAKYDAAIDRHAFIKPETQQRAWTPAVSTDGRRLPYGYGWFTQEYKGLTLIWHYGYWPGSYSSLYLKIPDKQISFILLANSDALSAPYGLEGGNVATSSFANTFLRLFVFEDAIGRTLAAPRWSQSPSNFKAEIEQFVKQNGDYRYDAEQISHYLMTRWLDNRRSAAR